MWRAIHPGTTETQRIPDQDGAPTFQVGFWPPSEDVRLRTRLRMFGRDTGALDPVKQNSELAEIAQAEADILRDCARWGCRGWIGGEGMPASTADTREIDGRKHLVLSEESLDVLHHNRLLPAVAFRVIAFNIPSGTEKKRPASPSPLDSSTLHTPAAVATQTGNPTTTTSSGS